MSILEAILLGLVQGLTEFIPISSSGHLVIFNHLLNIDADTFAFDVLLNIGTLSALIVYYRKRLAELIKRTVNGKEWKLLTKLAAATLPAFAVGLTFGGSIKILNDMVWVVVVMLFVVGILFVRYGSATIDANDAPLEKSITWPIAWRVGFAQALALIPGTSRSGITIFAGLNSGLSAARAAEFSFMLAIPTIAGASLKVIVLDGGWDFAVTNPGVVLAGNIASFLAGLLAVSFLIKLLSKRGLKDFGYYRIGLAVLLSVLLLTGII